MNLVPGRLDEGGAALLGEGGTRIQLPQAYPELGGRSLTLGVRPEHLEVCADEDALLELQVDFIELLGSDSLVHGHIGADKGRTRVTARLHASVKAQNGRTSLRFSAENLHLFDSETGKRFEA